MVKFELFLFIEVSREPTIFRKFRNRKASPTADWLQIASMRIIKCHKNCKHYFSILRKRNDLYGLFWEGLHFLFLLHITGFQKTGKLFDSFFRLYIELAYIFHTLFSYIQIGFEIIFSLNFSMICFTESAEREKARLICMFFREKERHFLWNKGTMQQSN